MAYPRQPTIKAEITGAALKNPQRHRNRAKPKVRPIGEPYRDMSPEQVAYWAQLTDEIPWLAAPDRPQLRMLCRLMAEYDRKVDDFPFSKLNMMRQILNSFGG